MPNPARSTVLNAVAPAFTDRLVQRFGRRRAGGSARGTLA